MSGDYRDDARRGVRYAQNFLTDQQLVGRLVRASALERADTVYEIGPGRGIITAELALRCQRVVAIERDAQLCALLRQRFARASNVRIHEGDFLRHPLPQEVYKVFANIPFNHTKAIVTRLTGVAAPEVAYLGMQREAAHMVMGRPRESLYSVLLKPWFEAEIVHRFQRGDFAPPPGVDVVLLRLRKRGPPMLSQADRQAFRDFVVYHFTGRQGCLWDSLLDTFSTRRLRHMRASMHIEADATPTSLAAGQWLDLFGYFQEVASAETRRLIRGSEERLKHQQAGLRKQHRTRVVRSGASSVNANNAAASLNHNRV